jgi:hypothetical protein
VKLAGPETRQGILAMPTARGEFPEAAQEVQALLGSFDFGTASLREAVPSLRMTALRNYQCGKVSGLAGMLLIREGVGAVFVFASGPAAAGWSAFPCCVIVS